MVTLTLTLVPGLLVTHLLLGHVHLLRVLTLLLALLALHVVTALLHLGLGRLVLLDLGHAVAVLEVLLADVDAGEAGTLGGVVRVHGHLGLGHVELLVGQVVHAGDGRDLAGVLGERLLLMVVQRRGHVRGSLVRRHIHHVASRLGGVILLQLLVGGLELIDMGAARTGLVIGDGDEL